MARPMSIILIVAQTLIIISYVLPTPPERLAATKFPSPWVREVRVAPAAPVPAVAVVAVPVVALLASQAAVTSCL